MLSDGTRVSSAISRVTLRPRVERHELGRALRKKSRARAIWAGRPPPIGRIPFVCCWSPTRAGFESYFLFGMGGCWSRHLLSCVVRRR
jgi:hypothetical protein